MMLTTVSWVTKYFCQELFLHILIGFLTRRMVISILDLYVIVSCGISLLSFMADVVDVDDLDGSERVFDVLQQGVAFR